MNEEELRQAINQAQETIQSLQAELALTNQGIMALVFELEQKLEERTANLRETQEELQRTNSELLQLTLELDDRVIERTEELEEKEKTLRETNQMMEAIIQASPLAIDAVDLLGRVILWSPASERLFGWTGAEVMGRQLPIVPENLQDDFQQQTEDALQGRGRTGKEIQRQKKDGSLVDVRISTAPLKDAPGQVTGVMAILEDDTERKRIEAELAEVQHRLLTSMETERRELAQDIHDGPIQDLYAITFSLKGMDTRACGEQAGAVIEEAVKNAQLSINRLREICGELRPPALAHLGLGKAIISHADKYQEKHPETHVEVDLQDEDAVLPEALSLGLFRIYQQAMINVARHAAAKNLVIRLTKENTQLVMEIKDDGKGFDVPKRWVEMAREGHLGLVGASERAAALGGRLAISSAAGKGTSIQAIIPFSADS